MDISIIILVRTTMALVLILEWENKRIYHSF